MKTQRSRLFQHNETKELVEVVESDYKDDEVLFSPQGGGFVKRATRESFDERFTQLTEEEVNERLESYQPVNVSLDGNHCLKGYTNGYRWNGWLSPVFEIDEVRKFIDTQNKIIDADAPPPENESQEEKYERVFQLDEDNCFMELIPGDQAPDDAFPTYLGKSLSDEQKKSLAEKFCIKYTYPPHDDMKPHYSFSHTITVNGRTMETWGLGDGYTWSKESCINHFERMRAKERNVIETEEEENLYYAEARDLPEEEG